jgi:hypothetical protein
MSTGDRTKIMERIVDFCVKHDMNEVYGIIETSAGKYRSMTICKSSILDGEIKIYSPKFIQVKWQTAIRALPENGSRVFESESDTLAFLKAAFVDYDGNAADAVPTKA